MLDANQNTQEREVPRMSYFNTELMKTLLQNDSVDEFFRRQLESAINELFQAELTAFLGYEKHSSDGWGSGNSRNGFYGRVFETKYGKLNLRVPSEVVQLKLT